jgi:hypothetical protein
MRIVVLVILFAANLSYAQTYTASAPVSLGSGFGYNHPQIEIANDGNPLVLWTDYANLNINLARHNGTGGFNTPVQLNPPGLEVQSYNWSGPDLSIDGNNVYVVFSSNGYEAAHIYVVKSTDNGLTFGDTVRVDNLTAGFGQFPDIVALNDTLWVTFMRHDAGGLNPRYVVCRSTDGGASFSNDVAAGEILVGEACSCCQPEIIANEDRVILFFRNNASNIREIKGVISTDRGESFTEWISVDDHNFYLNGCPSTGPDARFLTRDTCIAIYRTIVNSSVRIYAHEYDLGANSSIGEVQITPSGATSFSLNYPQIATSNGLIGAVWESSGNGTDVFFNASSSGIGGLNPANAINISDLAGTQFRADIAISNGLFHMIYSDMPDADIKYVQITSLAGIPDDEQRMSISAYPNPATDVLNVSIRSDKPITGILSLSTINGQAIRKRVLNVSGFNSTHRIALDGCSKGMYILRVESESETFSKRIVL